MSFANSVKKAITGVIQSTKIKTAQDNEKAKSPLTTRKLLNRKVKATTTTNGMAAQVSTRDYCTDLFFNIGASRNRISEVVNEFMNAYLQEPDVALRIAAWARDVRGGAGERKVFREIMLAVEDMDIDVCLQMIPHIPEWGRWDDLLIFKTDMAKAAAYEEIRQALLNNNGLCAKWMPRKGVISNELRHYLELSPKNYRKTLVNLTNVVETQMCANNWDHINFSQVPSLASARYKKAFNRHTPKYAQYVDALAAGVKGVKVNANAIFPHDVLKGMINWNTLYFNKTELDLVTKQWEALPNYVGSGNILPIVDVSGSMSARVGGNANLRCIDISVSLGLYLADKNRGVFKDVFMTFSNYPELVVLEGKNIVEKINHMIRSHWDMSTDLEAAFNRILEVATLNNLPVEDMPNKVIIFSDMQFNQCVGGTNAMNMIRKKYEQVGYRCPDVIFWNLNAHNNVPVSFNESGAALVSGFAPAVLEAILAGDLEEFTPRSIMLKAIMQDRYTI